MRKRLTIAAVATAATAVLGAGTAFAMTSAPAPAVQPVGNDVYACVNTAGGIGYLEFREPLPHACNPGLSLWHWPARVPPPASPAPSASATSRSSRQG